MVAINGLSPKRPDFFCIVNNQYSQECTTSDESDVDCRCKFQLLIPTSKIKNNEKYIHIFNRLF